MLASIREIARNNMLQATDKDIDVYLIEVTECPRTHDFKVDMCVYSITTENFDDTTMNVHHATCLARIENGRGILIESVL